MTWDQAFSIGETPICAITRPHWDFCELFDELQLYRGFSEKSLFGATDAFCQSFLDLENMMLTITFPRPSSGSYVGTFDQSSSFYFNGQLDSGSETETQDLGDDPKVFIEGMVVLDTNKKTARNLSTKAVVGDYPRSRGRMQYIKEPGVNGILVQIGGNQKFVGNWNNEYVGDLVSTSSLNTGPLREEKVGH